MKNCKFTYFPDSSVVKHPNRIARLPIKWVRKINNEKFATLAFERLIETFYFEN